MYAWTCLCGAPIVVGNASALAEALDAVAPVGVELTRLQRTQFLRLRTRLREDNGFFA